MRETVAPVPLIGREVERARLDGLLTSSSVAGKLTLLTGEPRIGKTRLLEYFSQCASNASYRVLHARCYEAESIRPYGIWIDALRNVPSGAAQTVDEALAPLLRPPVDGGSRLLGDERSRERLFEAVVALLDRLSVERRLAFVFDDLQWLDGASAALLHFVLRRCNVGSPVVFVGAARPADIDDNRFAAALLQSLGREGNVTRLGLAPLSANQVAALIDASRSALRPEQTMKDSGGNPLYVLELARAKQAPPEASALSIDVLIADRLAPLDAGTRDLLSFAASIGREFAPEQLAQLLDRPLADVLSSLTGLQRRGVLTAASQTGFDFAHDLVRQTVYRMLSQPHRRAIHRQIARQFLAASAHDARLHGEVVYHATLAGDAEIGYMMTPMARGIRLTTGAELAYRDALPTPVQLDAIEPIARETFPLGKRLDEQPWLGRRPCTPDMMPIIGARDSTQRSVVRLRTRASRADARSCHRAVAR